MLVSLRAKSATILGRTCCGVLVVGSHWQEAAHEKCGIIFLSTAAGALVELHGLG